ncbi:sensor histidine kinase [Pseudaestuariivita atlantica]|uniref:histidine kinase n=1 Tax=Pseudaestuariivita atlantica TaxID=1317121 RepID=A0A0L1JN66_9RHOB|nr:GAF domain-containing protein [Pseudaestuariivita atlantica]KNG93205.1 hypothetical protein ATO11_12150 [Pseudaestuariivita atlantica]
MTTHSRTQVASPTRLDDVGRLAALRQTGLLDTLPEEAFDRAVRLARAIIDAPVALISLVDDQRQFFKAHSGLPEPFATAQGTPLTHSFCQHVVTQDAELVVQDAREDVILRDNLAIRDLEVIAYLGVPLHVKGHAIGSFCAIDSRPREWTESDLQALRDIAATVETEINLRQAVSKSRLLNRELNHRVGNLFTIIGGMIAMTARQAATPSDMETALRGRISALAKAHDLIRPDVVDAPVALVSSGLSDILHRLVEPHVTRIDDQLSVAGPELRLKPEATTDLSLVVHELATNAAKYGALATQGGRVEVSWQRDGDTVRLRWTERCGPAIVSSPSPSGFGSKLIRVSVEGGLGGRLDSDWRPDGVVHDICIALDRFEDA